MIPTTERTDLIKKIEKYNFLTWVLEKYNKGDETLIDTRKRKELKKILSNPSTPFALVLLNEFHPQYNTFKELIEFVKEKI